MIIGFTSKTSSILSKLLCRKFRHCAVIFETDNGRILAQIGMNGIRIIPVGDNEIKILESHGGVFVEAAAQNRKTCNALTCVGFAKRALGISKPFIWTPDQLYRYLKKLS
jgi:hypothetical protein